MLAIIMAGPNLDGLLNPAMLVWSREQSHMDIAVAAKRAGQTDVRLEEWENGTRVPTLNQLRTLASVYKRSVGVFFLKEIPKSVKRPVDFRRMELSTHHVMSPALANGLREADAKRDAALDIFLQLDESPPVWDLELTHDIPPEYAAAALLERLAITMKTRIEWKSDYEALNGWRTAIEGLGVLVVQLSGVPIDEMRGCSLATFPLPVIILNSTDSPLGRVFTLLHELTHLARNESGLCDFKEDAPRSRKFDAVEAYCNHVAGAMLVPAEELLKLAEVQQSTPTTAWSLDQLKVLRRLFWASNEAILRRLLLVDKTSRRLYLQMRERFEQEYAEQRAKPAEPVIVPYYRRVLLSNGRFLTRLAVNAYSSSVITGSELSRILNSKLDHLPKIREALRSEVVA